MYAEAHLPIAVNQTFSYLIPQSLEKEIKKGSLVRLPFGKRFSIGYVENIIENKNYPGKIKPIDSIVSNVIADTSELIELINWMHHYYLTPKGLILKTIFSFLFNTKIGSPRKEKAIIITNSGINAIKSNIVKGIARKRILEHVVFKKNFTKISDLKNNFSISNNTIKTLLRDEYINLEEIEIDSNPLSDIKLNKKKTFIKTIYKTK